MRAQTILRVAREAIDAAIPPITHAWAPEAHGAHFRICAQIHTVEGAALCGAAGVREGLQTVVHNARRYRESCSAALEATKEGA